MSGKGSSALWWRQRSHLLYATLTATLSTETWLPVRGPCGAYGLVWSNNPALTHFASIVPLPSEECQRPVFLEPDSDVVAPFILTLQPYLTRQELCDATLEMNRSWALVAEAPGAAGSLKLISQCENTVDYITRQRLTIHHFENGFRVEGGRKLLPWCYRRGCCSSRYTPPSSTQLGLFLCCCQIWLHLILPHFETSPSIQAGLFI